jgi:phosphoglycerate dehydrogenase-like enzyme
MPFHILTSTIRCQSSEVKDVHDHAHYPMQELRGRTALIVGLGKIGMETARLARCFGMRTVGIKRYPEGDVPHVDEVHSPERLKHFIPQADAVIVTLPLPKRHGV